MTNATLSPATITAGTWTLDPMHSVANFRVRHFGITWMRGGFDQFDLSLTATDSGELTLAGSAPVAAINFTNDQLRGHLMSPEFFDAQLAPTIEFTSSAVELAEDGTATVAGSLSMRGATHPVTLTGTWSGPVTDMGGADRIGLELTGEIDRTTWGINWAAQLASGQDVLAKAVKLDGTFELVRQ